MNFQEKQIDFGLSSPKPPFVSPGNKTGKKKASEYPVSLGDVLNVTCASRNEVCVETHSCLLSISSQQGENSKSFTAKQPKKKPHTQKKVN